MNLNQTFPRKFSSQYQSLFRSLILLSLVLLMSCSESNQDDKQYSGASKLPTKDPSSIKHQSKGDSIWSSLESTLQFDQQVSLWKCDSAEAPVQLLEKYFLNEKSDTIAKIHYDDFNQVSSIYVKVATHKDFYWGKDYEIDSVHYVNETDLKAYRNDTLIWRETRVFDPSNFKLIERKRFSNPEKPILHEKYKYSVRGVLLKVKDLVLDQVQVYIYDNGELVKEHIETPEGIQDEVLYEYREDDGVRVGSIGTRPVIEEVLDSLDHVTLWKEWDARGKEHCFLYAR